MFVFAQRMNNAIQLIIVIRTLSVSLSDGQREYLFVFFTSIFVVVQQEHLMEEYDGICYLYFGTRHFNLFLNDILVRWSRCVFHVSIPSVLTAAFGDLSWISIGASMQKHNFMLLVFVSLMRLLYRRCDATAVTFHTLIDSTHGFQHRDLLY